MLRCSACKYKDYDDFEYPCVDCGPIHDNHFEPKKQTNADKIRSMTDEELADFLVNFAWDNEPGVDETYKWLQSEVEE